MKRNIILLIVLIGLAGLSYILITKKKSIVSPKSYDFSYREFAVKEVDLIKKIVLINRNKGLFTFEKQKDNWIINKKYNANKNAVKNMLAVIQKARIEYVPADAAVENIMKSMMYNAVKVELYDENNNAIKKYYIGGSPDNSDGTYFVMDGSAKPLVMGIPGFTGNLRVRFAYSIDDWRDRTVIDINHDDIQEVKMLYNFDKKSSFVINNNDGNFSVTPAFNISNNSNRVPDQNSINSYLLGFENKAAEAVSNSIEDKDDILSRSPIVEIYVTTKSNKTKSVKLYMIPILDEEVKKEKTGLDKYLNQEVLRYMALTDSGDLFLVQYKVFKDLFLTYDSFFK